MNNMGTVEKIVEVLNKMGCDKKAQATSRYEEHSNWLSSEFSSILNLIQPGTAVPMAEATAVSNSSASRQKRKSPETCSAGSRNSPLYKRNSGAEVDLAELLAAQGLPADLNKLKKDQLLEHLNAHGEHNLTMKNLKKDMVEALKEFIIQAHRKSIPEIPTELSKEENNKPDVQDVSVSVDKEEVSQPQPAALTNAEHTVEQQDTVQNKEVEQTVTSSEGPQSAVVERKPEERMVETLPPPPTLSNESPRKQSILSEFRQQISATTVTAPGPINATAVRSSILRGQTEESAEDRSARVQSEFEARKMRHRMSQVGRKSDASASSSVASGGTGSDVEKEVPTTVVEVTNEKSTPLEEELPLQSLMQTTEPANLTVEMETEDDDQSNWNEVPSPQRDNSEDESMVVVQSAKVEETAPVEKVKVEPVIGQVVKEKPVNNQSRVEAPVARPVSTKSATSDNAVKKPSNLVGGNQLSFLSSSKPATSAPAAGVKTNKSAVPALAMAARQKEKEEARALLKKKELEEKKREHLRKMQQQQLKSGSSRTLGVSKIASSAPSSTTNASASSKSALEKSFGWALGKKKEESVSDTKENKISAPPAKPIASSSSSAKSSSSSADKEVPVLSEKKINPAEYRQVTPSKPATPQQVPVHDVKVTPTVEVSPPREEYKIEDDEDSDSDSGSGTDDDEDDKKKQIPDWAKGPKLREALERQYGLNGHVAVDPDKIFPDVQACSLEDIFGKREGKCGKYSVRTSSAKWDEDEITLVEKRKYRSVMGYI